MLDIERSIAGRIAEDSDMPFDSSMHLLRSIDATGAVCILVLARTYVWHIRITKYIQHDSKRIQREPVRKSAGAK